MTVTDQNQTPEATVPPEVGAADVATSQTAQGADAGEPDPQAEIARLQVEKKELNERMLRLAADFENYKKRVRREMEEAGIRGMESLLKDIFPVIDNLDRAVEAGAASVQGSGQAAALLEGVRLVQKQLLGALEKAQVKTFDALGKPFDPNIHEAVQQVDSDTLAPGTVATVFQRGYMAGSRLLRPAMVAVVRPQPQGGSAADGAAGGGDGGSLN